MPGLSGELELASGNLNQATSENKAAIPVRISLTVLASVLAMAAGWWSFGFLERIPCSKCDRFEVQLNLVLDRMTFKVEQRAGLALLEDLRFESVEIDGFESLRVQSGADSLNGSTFVSANGNGRLAIAAKYSRDDSRGELQGLPSFGGISAREGTKLMVQGFLLGDNVLRLTIRRRYDVAGERREPIVFTFPSEVEAKLSIWDAVSRGERSTGNCSGAGGSNPIVCEGRMAGGIVEVVPSEKEYSVLLGLPRSNGNASGEFVLTHVPTRVSELSFSALDQNQEAVTTIRSGEVFVTNYVLNDFNPEKPYRLYASDPLLLPREAQLLMRDLRVRSDGAVGVVLKGKVSSMSVGSALSGEGSEALPVVVNSISISWYDWLLSTEWAKNTLWGVLGSAFCAFVGAVWKLLERYGPFARKVRDLTGQS